MPYGENNLPLLNTEILKGLTKMNTELTRILSLLVLATTLFAGLAIATPMLTASAEGNDDKDSPSDNDQGYGNDPGNSGDAHKKNNKRD